MNEEMIDAIINCSMALEEMIEVITIGIRNEHGDDVATSVLINVATTMLAEVMVTATPESRELVANAIQHEIVAKVGERKASSEAKKAVDTAMIRAKVSHFTCYPNNTKKH